MAEKDERARGEAHQSISLYRLVLRGQGRARRVEGHLPPRRIELVGNAKRHRFVMGVEEQQKARILGALPLAVAYLGRSAVEEHAESAHPAAVLPVLRHHPLAVGPEPDDVLVGMLRLRVAVVERIAMKIGMLFA